MRVFRNECEPIFESALILTKVSVDKDVQPSNIAFCISRVLFAYVAEPREVHPVKLLPATLVAEYVAGMTTERRAVQPWNTYPFIPVIFPSVTVDNCAMFWNAFPPIVVRLVGELKEDRAVPTNA
jgi:hypothetical protein